MKKIHILISDEFEGASLFSTALANYFQLETLNVTILFREQILSTDELSLEIKKHLDAGEVIPAHLVMQMIQAHIQGINGDLLVTRFPRTTEQFDWLVEIIKSVSASLVSVWYLKLEKLEPYSEYLYKIREDYNDKYEITQSSIKEKILGKISWNAGLIEHIGKHHTVKIFEYDFEQNWNSESIIERLSNY